MLRWGFVLAVTAACFPWAPGLAQEAPQEPEEALRVFLDCQGGFCDFNFFRTEIVWVNWVRDRQVAQVHLLMTTQPSGGGREYTLRFIGLGGYQGRDDEIRTFVSQTATADEERRIVVRAMKLGLASYAARLAIRDRLDVTYRPPAAQPAGQAQRPSDPWNFWVFRISGSGFFQGESRQSSSSLNGSASASRITDDWKLRFRVRGNRSTSSFTLRDGSRLETVTTGSGGEALVVRSIGAHWSIGVLAEVNQSDRLNLDLSSRVAPGIEFNVFPYTESTRRQLTLLYEVGGSRVNYADTTIFGMTEETLADHRLQATLVQREPWGSSSLSFTVGSYLHDVGKNRLVLSGGLSLRVVRGLDLNLNGSYSRVRDQLSLPKAGATNEEVLLRLRQLQTSYRYFVQVGLSYTFGSIFNNVVNPRFSNRDGGGEVIFFF
jgi:hypothetical protein